MKTQTWSREERRLGALCVCSSLCCGHILLCLCLHTTVCWVDPNSPWRLSTACACISFALQSRGHLNIFSSAAGLFHQGPRPPSSQSSAQQEPRTPSSQPSCPIAVFFWTGWQVDHHFVCPFVCTVNWSVTFYTSPSLTLNPLCTLNDCGCFSL